MKRTEITSGNPDQIKKELADLYLNVCDEFYQGTLNVFGTEETTFCVIRDKISFSRKGLLITDFEKYLAENKIRNSELSYLEFCSGYTTKNKVFGTQELKQMENYNIDTNKEYAIIFVYAKGEEEIKEILNLVAGTSESHIITYIGTGLIVGGGVLVYTGYGSLAGVPLIIAGKAIAGGGLALATVGSVLNYFTNENVGMEWASFFLIREFNEEELKKLNCEYLPSQQN